MLSTTVEMMSVTAVEPRDDKMSCDDAMSEDTDDSTCDTA
jgi:hypothetical protein